MITVSADWLSDRWAALTAEGSVQVALSLWDAGDAFTLASLGSLPASEQVEGRVVLRGRPAPHSSVTIELQPVDPATDSSRADLFLAPNGETYLASGSSDDVGGSRRPVPVEIVSVVAALAERRNALFETAVLAETGVLIIGLGTGGIHVAIELAKAGVGRFALVDPDRLSVGNVARHHAGVSHAGRRKVHAARDLILEKNPAAQIETHPDAAKPETADRVRGLMDAYDVIVCATDDRPSKLLVNSLALSTGKTAIYGGAFRRAYGGQVLRVRPGSSACYQCFVMAMPENASDQEVASVEDAVEIAYSDRPVPIQPGLALDVAPIALMVTRLTLHELLRGRETAFSVLDRDFAASWYLWINRPETGTPYQDWPPLSESSDEMTILRWYGIDFEKEAACPECGNFAGALRRQYGLDDSLSHNVPTMPSNLTVPE